MNKRDWSHVRSYRCLFKAKLAARNEKVKKAQKARALAEKLLMQELRRPLVPKRNIA